MSSEMGYQVFDSMSYPYSDAHAAYSGSQRSKWQVILSGNDVPMINPRDKSGWVLCQVLGHDFFNSHGFSDMTGS
jgi:hypothetical protein